MDLKSESVKSSNFSVAFEQMCSFVAIANTQNIEDTLKQVVIQCFVVLPEERFVNSSQIVEAIESVFGLRVSENQVQNIISQLSSEGIVKRPTGTNLVISAEVQGEIEKGNEEALILEKRVQEEWLIEVSMEFPELSIDKMWPALRAYLTKAFRRHGIQTAALFDPLLDITSENSKSLAVMLSEVVKGMFDADMQANAHKAISNFFYNIAGFNDRSKYVSQLADGAFHYFSLTVDPTVAKQFRKKLSNLTLFLDTNFLISILGLDDDKLVDVSNQLLSAINNHNFPFVLRYHPSTFEELDGTIQYFKSRLASNHWPTALSRAAINTRCTPGIEMKYHQKNVDSMIDVDTYFKPYDHLDIILKGKNIDIYMSSGQAEERTHQLADLYYEYKEFLVKRGKDKSHGQIEHDMIMLDKVRQLRSGVKTTLEAGALIVTCDKNLYLFDWETSRKEGGYPCTILPNLFWQILRPFISDDIDFDRAFAETFAIPEIRSISSSSQAACRKLLCMLTAYEGISEESATRMLSNDLLIDRIKEVTEDEEIHEIIKLAIVEQNEMLSEEIADRDKQLDYERVERIEKEKKLNEEKTRVEEEKRSIEEDKKLTDKALLDERKQVVSTKKILAEVTKKAEEVAFDNEKKELDILNIKQAAREDNFEKEKIEQEFEKYKKLSAIALAIVTSVVLLVVFLGGVRLFEWKWLINHTNSLGLQASVSCLLVVSNACFWFSKRRSWLFGVAVIGFIWSIISLLDNKGV